jgi:hypothetical protein
VVCLLFWCFLLIANYFTLNIVDLIFQYYYRAETSYWKLLTGIDISHYKAQPYYLITCGKFRALLLVERLKDRLTRLDLPENGMVE